jgi:hypothetical protein
MGGTEEHPVRLFCCSAVLPGREIQPFSHFDADQKSLATLGAERFNLLTRLGCRRSAG